MSEPAPVVVIVEDEPQMRRFLSTTLRGHNYVVFEAGTGAAGLACIGAEAPAVVLLDLGLPDGDGLDVLARLRQTSSVPVIVLSARGREDDKVAALDGGANDYLTKPFGVGELLARLRVVLRTRPAVVLSAGTTTPPIVIGELRIDQDRHEVTVGEIQIKLTPIEFKLLAALAQHAGKVRTHRQLARDVWGPTNTDQAHTLRVHMASLRRKLETDAARPYWLQTELGVGYRLRDEP